MSSDVDPQFAGIFTLVAALQISLVAYARNQPYIEPTTIEDVDLGYTRVIMPDRRPEPPQAPEDEGRAAPESKGPPAQKASGPVRIDRKDVSKKGLIRAIGRAGAKGGAVHDLFEDGAENRALAEAFDGITGIELGGEAVGARGGGGETVEIETLHTEHSASVAVGDKRETRAPGGEAEPEGPPEVDGPLTPAEVDRVMKRHLGALKACYEGALKRDRKLGGKLVLRFEVSAQGRTQNLGFASAGLKSRDVEACISKRARHWRFPESEGVVFVEYPILFTPSP